MRLLILLPYVLWVVISVMAFLNKPLNRTLVTGNVVVFWCWLALGFLLSPLSYFWAVGL